MKASVYFERNVNEQVDIEVKDLNHLKELTKDSDALWNLISEQGAQIIENCGEMLDVKYSYYDKNGEEISIEKEEEISPRISWS